jgi:hypothetical protein
VVQDLKADWGEQSPMRTFKITSPSGVVITLWGMVKPGRKPTKQRKSG